MDKDNYFSVSETANIMGISRTAVLKKIYARRLKAERIGHFWAIPKEELGVYRGEILTEKQKKTIEAGVKKTVQEYGEVLEKLGKE